MDLCVADHVKNDDFPALGRGHLQGGSHSYFGQLRKIGRGKNLFFLLHSFLLYGSLEPFSKVLTFEAELSLGGGLQARRLYRPVTAQTYPVASVQRSTLRHLDAPELR